MKLWIDDVRLPPDQSWHWAKTSKEAIEYYYKFGSEITEISFDHDLGGEDTSIKLAHLMEGRAFDNGIAPPKWYVHSANPVGKQNLISTLENANIYAKRK